MQFLKQLMALVRMNLSGIRQRLGPVLTVVIGVTCAVGTLVSLLAMGAGAQRQAMANVRADRVVITGAGAQTDIPRDASGAIRNLPGIRKGAGGESIVTRARSLLSNSPPACQAYRYSQLLPKLGAKPSRAIPLLRSPGL